MAAPINSRGNLEGERFPNLETVIGRMLPTPRANDPEKRGNFNPHNPRNGLPAAVRLLTPCATDWKGRTNWQAAGRDGPQRLSDCLPIGGGMYLNPSFVEEMMGFPVGWTACEP